MRVIFNLQGGCLAGAAQLVAHFTRPVMAGPGACIASVEATAADFPVSELIGVDTAAGAVEAGSCRIGVVLMTPVC